MICVYRHIKMCDLITVIVQLILLCIQHGQYCGLGKQDGALLLLSTLDSGELLLRRPLFIMS